MQQLSNFSTTELDGSIDDSVTSIDVLNGSAFPSVGVFNLYCDGEYLRCTARSGDTLTVVRGVEGTVAASHLSGAPITLVLSKEVLENMMADMCQYGPAANIPASAPLGATYYASDMNYGWRWNGTKWLLCYPIQAVNGIDLTGWTALNHGTETWNLINGILTCEYPISASGIRGYYKNLPTPPYTINMVTQLPYSNKFTVFSGIGVHRLSTGASRTISMHNPSTNNNEGYIQFQPYSNLNTPTTPTASQQQVRGMYTTLRIRDDSTNRYFEGSTDGVNFITIRQEANTAIAADCIIIFTDNRTTTTNYPFQAVTIDYWEN